MRFFLGVDGGQSGTTAVIGDETGRVLGRGDAGPCNHAGAGEGRAKLERAVRTSLQLACEGAGLDSNTIQFAVACFGMSGGPEDKQEILAALLRTERLLVTTDAVTALAGATAHGRGIITIAGTGSIAFGRNAAGATARAGGWGYVFGDEGGAFDLVRQSLRAALRMEEGWGPPTSLRATLLEATGVRLAPIRRCISFIPTSGRARALRPWRPWWMPPPSPPMRSRSEIVNRAAIDLAMLAASVRQQLWQPGDAVEVAYIGGVFESLTVRERFRLLVEMETGSRCGPPLHGPAEGALLEAYRAAGLDPVLKR